MYISCCTNKTKSKRNTTSILMTESFTVECGPVITNGNTTMSSNTIIRCQAVAIELENSSITNMNITYKLSQKLKVAIGTVLDITKHDYKHIRTLSLMFRYEDMTYLRWPHIWVYAVNVKYIDHKYEHNIQTITET